MGCKPDSVIENGYLSGAYFAISLGPAHGNERGFASYLNPKRVLLGIAPGGVCPAGVLPHPRVSSYLTISPFPVPHSLT